MAVPNAYQITARITNPTAVTQLQIGAASSKPLTIVRIEISNANITASTAGEILFKVTSTGTTGQTTFTPLKLNPSDAAAGMSAATGVATAEGTLVATAFNKRVGFNLVSNYPLILMPEERPFIAGGQFFALNFPAAITAILNLEVVVQEFG